MTFLCPVAIYRDGYIMQTHYPDSSVVKTQKVLSLETS